MYGEDGNRGLDIVMIAVAPFVIWFLIWLTVGWAMVEMDPNALRKEGAQGTAFTVSVLLAIVPAIHAAKYFWQSHELLDTVDNPSYDKINGTDYGRIDEQ